LQSTNKYSRTKIYKIENSVCNVLLLIKDTGDAECDASKAGKRNNSRAHKKINWICTDFICRMKSKKVHSQFLHNVC